VEAYQHPFYARDNYWDPFETNIEKHSMHSSLTKYLEMKINSELSLAKTKTILIQGKFDRNKGISKIEKNDKLFNYMRPTISADAYDLSLNCFPGKDYVFHYANIIKNYFSLSGKKVNIDIEYPSEEDCEQALINSNLSELPKASVVILGYVEAFESLSTDESWSGTGNFLWKKCTLKNKDAILVGCKHTYWGDIAGRIVSYLARNNDAKCVIYCGKLGTLNEDITPNEALATGNKSVFPNGNTVEWTNIFSNSNKKTVKNGVHVTVPSVLQEDINLVDKYKDTISFIDPEIGHMALAAQNTGIVFSYLHIISDNLVKHFDSDLSNERKDKVIRNREILINDIIDELYQLNF